MKVSASTGEPEAPLTWQVPPAPVLLPNAKPNPTHPSLTHRWCKLLATVALCTQAAAYESRHQSTTDSEIFGYGNFLGDGTAHAIVIDRTTGTFRLATQAVGGAIHFGEATPSGLTSIDTFTAGTIRDPNSDTIAVAGILANRIHILDPGLPAISPLAVFTDTVGPRAISSAAYHFPDFDNTRMDLAVQAGWIDSPDTAAAIFKSDADGLEKVFEGPSANLAGIQRVRVTQNEQDYQLVLVRDTGTGTLSAILTDPLLPDLPSPRTVPGLPGTSQLVHGAFGTSGINYFLFFTPGSADLTVLRGIKPQLLTDPTNATLEASVRSIHHARGADGSQRGFFAIFGDGSYGRFFHFDSSHTLVPGATLLAPAGERLTGLLSPGPDRVAALSGPLAGGPSTRAIEYQHVGGAWQQSGETLLAPPSPAASSATAVFFRGEPFVNPNAVVTRAVRIPDWTSNPVLNPTTSTVDRENFDSPTTGLGSRETFPLGPAAPDESHLWANQLGADVSIILPSSVRGPAGPALEISPPPGTYDRYITPVITTTDPTATIHFRTDPTEPWTTTTGGTATITPPGATLRPFQVAYFARSSTGVATPVQIAHYTFRGNPGDIDSDGDGIPDFVELALGLNPLGGDDSDGDGFSDLREILAGTNPADPSDFPASLPDIEWNQAFDLRATPASFNSHTPNPLVPDRPSFAENPNPDAAPATRIRVHSLDGSLLQSANTRNHPTPPTQPGAQFTALPATDLDGFLVASTTPTFAILPTPGITTVPDPQADDLGVELISLVPVPTLVPQPFIAPTIDPLDDPVDAAAAWIAAATTHYNNLTRTSQSANLTFRQTLALLMTERLIALLLAERDPAFDPDTFTLTNFRDGTADPSALLRSLRTPDESGHAYLPQEIHTLVTQRIASPPGTPMIQLRALAAQIYRTAGTLGAANPGLYPSPIDTLRAFLKGAPLPGHGDATSYAAAVTLTSAQLDSARTALPNILSALQPRPVATFAAEIDSATFTGAVPILRIEGTGVPLKLYNARRQPYPFPRGLDLPVGTRLTVTAFNDRTLPPFSPGQAVEVISITVTSLPVPAIADTIGNAIDDAWEIAFFGTTGIDPFGDADGDGYTNLHEFLARTDPTSATSTPAGPPLPNEMPTPRISMRADGTIDLEFDFPTTFANQLGFRLQTSDDLTGFQEQPIFAQPDGPESYHLHLSFPESTPTKAFFRFRLTLGE